MDKVLQSMKLMAWERAKGELQSIGHASYTGDFNRFIELMEEFIEKVENEGLIEG